MPLIRRMVREGLVTAERNGRDGRLVNIILTDRGWEVLNQATPVAQEIVDQVMLSIGESDAVPLEKSLRVLRQNAHDGLERVAKRSQPQSS